MQLSREEFWILDATAQLNFAVPLSLLNHPRVDISFNKPHHNLTTDQLIDLLEVMQKRGDLAIYRHSKELFPECEAANVLERAPQTRIVIDYTPIWESPVLYPKAAIIECFYVASEERKENPVGTRVIEALCFCATRQGAAKWEQTAQVDWSKYLDWWGTGGNEDADLAENQSLSYGRVAALSEQTLGAYFEWKTRWDAHPDSRETSSFKRYHTERIVPWKATYWKTFPEGFECDFMEYTVRRTRMNKAESERHSVFWKQSRSEHHALFDWCNKWVKDFPFAGD